MKKHEFFLVIVAALIIGLGLLTVTEKKSEAATHNYAPYALLTSSARANTATGTASSTATGSGDAVDYPNAIGLLFILDVTANATDAADKLDVYVQTKLGDTWYDCAHFTQCDGNGSGDLTYVTKICANSAQAEYEIGTALGETAVRHLLGRQFRARWVVTDTGNGDASFTFSVTAVPL